MCHSRRYPWGRLTVRVHPFCRYSCFLVVACETSERLCIRFQDIDISSSTIYGLKQKRKICPVRDCISSPPSIAFHSSRLSTTALEQPNVSSGLMTDSFLQTSLSYSVFLVLSGCIYSLTILRLTIIAHSHCPAISASTSAVARKINSYWYRMLVVSINHTDAG